MGELHFILTHMAIQMILYGQEYHHHGYQLSIFIHLIRHHGGIHHLFMNHLFLRYLIRHLLIRHLVHHHGGGIHHLFIHLSRHHGGHLKKLIRIKLKAVKDV